MFDLGYMMSQEDVEILNQAAVFIGGFLLFSLAVSLLVYIFQGIGLFKMAKSLNLAHPWMAWVPFLNTYTLGKIGSKYVKKDGRLSAKFGGWLLALEIGVSVFVCVFMTAFVFMVINAFNMVVNGGNEPEPEFILATLIFVISYLICLGICIAYTVIRYVALWRLYAIFSNANATTFTVVSVLFNIATPFILFAIRNNQPEIFGSEPIYAPAAEIPEFSINE